MSWSDKLNKVSVYSPHDLDLIKSRLKKDKPLHDPKTHMEDPYDLNTSMGYKERKYHLDFNILKQIPGKLGMIAAIIQTRTHQVASFAFPFRSTKSLGYQIKHKNPHKLTTKGEREMILDLENYIQNCGLIDKNNPLANLSRDNFKVLLTKLVRDSLTFDQVAVELVPTNSGIPYEFIAVDASTIRLAAADFSEKTVWNSNTGYKDKKALTSNGKDTVYVQVIDGKIENVYSRDELIFGVRNPRTDIHVAGYGYSELEMMVNTITAHLNAETHNSKFFSNSTSAKGILNFKGDSMAPDQLEGFRRLWRDQMESVQNAWRTPILQSEAGIEWIDLSKANRDMEFSQWLEYLLKVGCSVFSIDPSEIGFDIQGGVSQTPLFESANEHKLKASRDKGLRPLLTFFEDLINRNIIQRIDDDFIFQFVGLDELTEEQKTEQRIKQLGGWLTINEARRAEDLPDIEGGDIVLNPTYTGYLQAMKQQEMDQQQAAQQTQMPAEGQDPQMQQSQQGMEDDGDMEEHVPQYNF